ncbi:MAG: hypothetical protein GWO41_09115 [candidate division Zixibacteria bacterium]|nr:hypothetical protein [candidate division Zixibacteria bacterium]NIR65866.1 hypothetical protein [candidate division Zixibacteria bacterium]NIS16504.1 hypothetical protein [candidate division Zixibacteria bacterium]NIS47520.1 hypothetical protein [candidate division Zixibacteria bacterium]NIT52877.1 hypothetical protein [candidate division Zixibacteria bacterium]
MPVRSSFIAVTLLLLPAAALCAQDQTVSNDIFVKQSFHDMADSLLNGMTSSEDLHLVFKCEDCPKEFFRDIVIGVLKQRVENLYINNGDISFDRLEINLYNYDFSYDRVGGSLFSSGRLFRNFEAAVYATLYDRNSKVLWQKDYSDAYSEEIEWDQARSSQVGDGSTFNAELPSTDRNRIWEPVIISGLLGGMVYLFFASR